MSTIYDDKGKIFTDIVRKDAITANIQTTLHRIEGVIHISAGKRVSDELESPTKFIAVTDAKIIALDGKVLFETEFMTIAKEQVVWLIPGEITGA